MKQRQASIVLGTLACLFAMRVIGQLLVAIFELSWLPPMDQWYSGMIPYIILLPIQILILVFQAAVSRELWVGRGWFCRPRRLTSQTLIWFSYVYAASMAVRYIVSIAMVPERMWFDGIIPILFHFVLAAYLWVLGRTLGNRALEPESVKA